MAGRVDIVRGQDGAFDADGLKRAAAALLLGGLERPEHDR